MTTSVTNPLPADPFPADPFPADPFPTDPLSVLKGMYEAESRYLAAGGPGAASFDLLAPYFADDVVLHQADSLPYGGTWHRHDGMARFFLAMSLAWERFDILDQRFLGVDGDTVVVHSRIRARARATGRELEFPIVQTIEVRDGRIARVRPFYWDTAAIAEACAEPAPARRRGRGGRGHGGSGQAGSGYGSLADEDA
ncbi:nuclear transport factor 2 family protein [Streptomyces huiliensis]|uniref:nuclear transport factor 2 family protein n=1 Tax=Streptomyces huiliensis TaxID=2876027 RepID=UPI0027E04312|nr:nuclear transport factor 2 family protein [Streptomyces huiliensis]MBZ4322129.1 nuclear transport factor 2 family protein [Streptomyces huiliensis]